MAEHQAHRRYHPLFSILILLCVLGMAALAIYVRLFSERVMEGEITMPTTAYSNIVMANPLDRAHQSAASDGTWRVQSKSAEIGIVRHEAGGADKKITYFAADIVAQDGKAFAACFAKDEYGLNIREKTSHMARRVGAAFAINGDYYGYRSDGIVIRNGTLYRDEPSDRAGMTIFEDGHMEVYDETTVSGEDLLAGGAWDAFSFGPVLVENGAICEGLDQPYGVDTMTIQKKQPRTAIGMIEPGHFIIVVVDGRQEGYSSGMTLAELNWRGFLRTMAVKSPTTSTAAIPPPCTQMAR